MHALISLSGWQNIFACKIKKKIHGHKLLIFALQEQNIFKIVVELKQFSIRDTCETFI